MMMQEGQTRFTFTRTRDDKWAIHVNGTRKTGQTTSEVLQAVADMLGEPESVRTIMIEVVGGDDPLKRERDR